MNDLYDIITALRQRNHLSVRMLAMRADIPPTTLASMMTRRPSTMDKSFLIQIAKALGVKWVMLLNKPDSYADECELEDRISVEMTQEDIEAVQRNLIEPFTTVARFGVREQRFSDYIADTCRRRRSEESDFKQSFAFVLDKLNDDGLLEAMRRVLEIATEPRYRKMKEEAKECQEEELRMAAEQSENDLMDAGRPRPL